MYTNYNSNLEKNQMMTPPIIGLTSSIVNDKLNNISLEDNSTGLFKIEDSKIKPLVEMPIETNNFIISGTDEEIDSNENNAVNKRYLINKCVGKDDQSVTFNIVNAKRYKLINDRGDLEMSSTSFSFPNGDSRIYFPAINLNNSFFILADRSFTDKPISIAPFTGIEFNTNSNGEITDTKYQKTCLKNLVTSEITTELRKQLILNNLMDNVCPTYRFCERNYAKTDDIDSVYETLDTKVNNDYLTTNYYDKTTIDNKFTENQFDSDNYYTKDEVDTNISTVNSNFSNYYTKTEINQRIKSGGYSNWQQKINSNSSYLSLNEDEVFAFSFNINGTITNLFSSPSESEFYVYNIVMKITPTVNGEDLTNFLDNRFIKNFILKIDDGVYNFNGWWKNEDSAMYVSIPMMFGGKFVPTKMEVYFVPKTKYSTITVRFFVSSCTCYVKRVD